MGLRTQLCRKILPYAIKKGYGEEMLEMVQALQKAKKTELFAHDMVYHPMKTNSTFYLPYAVTDWIQRKIFVTDNYFEYKNLNYIFRTFRGGQSQKLFKTERFSISAQTLEIILAIS